ncbi:hypothetical protein BsIDN1_22880 [Bacillus safensis]|uniref:Uncharacterized protein n=1 Tax=Bacillus safensis TaxID=561879 RepID=A0A5S9M4Z8_BACIA|nr:hypothetical protein BsIDN1_22880 [Bacillus safensis]
MLDFDDTYTYDDYKCKHIRTNVKGREEMQKQITLPEQISHEKLADLYKQMWLVRYFDEKSRPFFCKKDLSMAPLIYVLDRKRQLLDRLPY